MVLMEEGKTTLAGLPGGMWRYSVNVKGITESGIQIWTVSDKKAYTFTYTASQALYEPFLPIFKQMTESFEILR